MWLLMKRMLQWVLEKHNCYTKEKEKKIGWKELEISSVSGGNMFSVTSIATVVFHLSRKSLQVVIKNPTFIKSCLTIILTK